MGLCLDEPPEYVRCAGDSAAFPLAGNVNGMRVRAIDVFQFNDAGKIQSMRAYFGQDDLTPQ
jgi:steroid delta-isomerase